MLYPFTGDISCDGGVVTLTGNFVYFVYKYNPILGLIDIIVGSLKQSGKDAFNVFTHIARLCQNRGIDYGQWHFEQFGNGLRQKGFSRSGLTDQNHIAFLDFNLTFPFGMVDAFVVVINRYREDLFGRFLSDNVVIEKSLNFFGRMQFYIKVGLRLLLSGLFFDNSVGLKNTLITNVRIQTCNKQLRLRFGPATKGTV